MAAGRRLGISHGVSCYGPKGKIDLFGGLKSLSSISHCSRTFCPNEDAVSNTSKLHSYELSDKCVILRLMLVYDINKVFFLFIIEV